MRKGSGALFKKANPAMRNAVKTVGRLAKETSKTAYKEVRSKWKDMQTVRDLDDTAYPAHGHVTQHKPRSAPSSPKLRSGDRMAGRLSPSSTLKRAAMHSTLLERAGHGLRRCETSVSQHYHVGSSPGYQQHSGLDDAGSSSSGDNSTDDELHMLPLDLGNLMDDMKDVLAKTAVSSPPPPIVDRSVSENDQSLSAGFFLGVIS